MSVVVDVQAVRPKWFLGADGMLFRIFYAFPPTIRLISQLTVWYCLNFPASCCWRNLVIRCEDGGTAICNG